MKRLALFTLTLMLTFAMETDSYAALEQLDETTTLSQSASVPSDDYRRHAISVELLGRGLLYSFNYDYLIHDDIALGAGLSTYSFSSGNSTARVTFLPVYANYYFTPGEHRWFASGGVNLIHASGKIDQNEKISGSGAAGILGGGYEFRGDNGFLFRATPYVFVGKASGFWLGFSLGYSI
jgi:hypothetical protein